MPAFQPAESFLTYRHYIRALAQLAGYAQPMVASDVAYPELAQRIRALPTLGRLPVEPDLAAVKRSLMNAWGTELLMAVTSRYSQHDELMRLTNNWAAVQLYYVFYHATQALVIARGRPRPESHPATRKLFLELWTARTVDCAPWSLGYQMSPKNVPAGHSVNSQITTIAPPRSPGACIDYVYKGLFTTRNEDLPDARKAAREFKLRERKREWQERQKGRSRPMPKFPLPRLTEEEKSAVQTKLRCYSIMDLLWRLRIKTHYLDGTMMLEGPADLSVSAELNRDMQNLASSTMLLFELHLVRQLGLTAVQAMAGEWLARNKATVTIGLGQRLPLLSP